jgi:hypothetical protein
MTLWRRSQWGFLYDRVIRVCSPGAWGLPGIRVVPACESIRLTEIRSAASRCQHDPGDFQQLFCLILFGACAFACVQGRRCYSDATAMQRSTALRSISWCSTKGEAATREN